VSASTFGPDFHRQPALVYDRADQTNKASTHQAPVACRRSIVMENENRVSFRSHVVSLLGTLFPPVLGSHAVSTPPSARCQLLPPAPCTPRRRLRTRASENGRVPGRSLLLESTNTTGAG
jgi:hypothetical protein